MSWVGLRIGAIGLALTGLAGCTVGDVSGPRWPQEGGIVGMEQFEQRIDTLANRVDGLESQLNQAEQTAQNAQQTAEASQQTAQQALQTAQQARQEAAQAVTDANGAARQAEVIFERQVEK